MGRVWSFIRLGRGLPKGREDRDGVQWSLVGGSLLGRCGKERIGTEHHAAPTDEETQRAEEASH